MLMRIAGPEAIGPLLVSRLSATGRAGEPVTVRDLLRTFLPYGAVRSALGLTMKVEYDLALLRFLGSDEHVRVDADLAEAIRRELSTSEPSIDSLDDLGEARVEMLPEAWAAWSGGAWPLKVVETTAEEKERPSTEVAKGPTASETATRHRCRRCGRSLPESREVRFCPICGADQAEPACAECNERLERGWVYCPRCGKTIER